MNDLDLLKRYREDTAAAAPEVLAAARRRLVTPKPDRTRVVFGQRRMLLAGALAVTLAGGILVTDVVERGGATPAGTVADAGTFLADAAAATSAEPDDPIPAGKYLQIDVESTRLVPLGSNPRLRATLYSGRTTWIASDRKPPYPTAIAPTSRVEFASPEARALARKTAPYLFVTTKPGLAFNHCPTIGPGSVGLTCEPSWTHTTFEFLAAQPRDPDALLAALRRDPAPMDGDTAAWHRVASVLSLGVVPADLRAALYQAVRKLPGIELLDEVVTVDGRRARAIGREGDGYRTDLLIAEADGRFLGSRTVVTRDGPPDINGRPERSLRAGDIQRSSVVTTRITSTPPPSK
ncbi:CU044_5270 family protein [Kribbella shirazensis]|uniref:CU044_5270 family protein n=1 Tax=Kribbella shirazensis TaxID=1105143 RepID=A0A7X6A4E4_9ACTN|nr:CU044_5270 family protein [Kribbella shirazensis]NIK60873.1 hypothetical protein [Kribbella shirazensis]